MGTPDRQVGVAVRAQDAAGAFGRVRRDGDRLKVSLDEAPDLTGAYDYRAGDSGTVSVPAGARVLSITAMAQDGFGDGSVVIGGGDTIIVPEGFPFTANPEGQLTGPVDIVFTSTQAFFVDWIE